MTCIVGIKDGNDVYIGGDDFGGNTKVFKGKRDIIYGCTTSFRMIQLLRFVFNPTVPEGDIYEWMVTEFTKQLRTCFKDNGFSKVDNNVESGGQFLVGIKGRLFGVLEDFQIAEPEHGYDTLGSGFSYALGSLHATDEWKDDISPDDRVIGALESAQTFAPTVGAPGLILVASWDPETDHTEHTTMRL